MRQPINPLSPAIAKLSTNSLLSATEYRTLVVVADLADNGNKISSYTVAEKLGVGHACGYVNLKKLVKLGFLLRVPKTRDTYVFRSQEHWFQAPTQPANNTTADVVGESSLRAEIKALQELTKELFNKLGQ